MSAVATADLWVFPEALDAFIAECRMLLSHARTLEHVLPTDEEHLELYLNNSIRAANAAKKLGGGVFIA